MAKRQSDEMNRAEKVRARGQQSRKKTQAVPFGNSATRKQTKHTVPVTRRTKPPSPAVNLNRRKVQVPLRTKGAELQLPAFPRYQLGWRLISGAVFVLSLAVVFSFTSLNAFEISAINLKGAQRLGGEAILAQVDLVGTSIISVQPEEIERLISESFPSLSKVSISTGLPASVTIRVVEREPLIFWQQNNASLWIDAEGVMFPVRGEVEVPLTVIANDSPPAPPTANDAETPEDVDELSMLREDPFPHTTPEFVMGILPLSGYLPEGSNLQYDPQFGLGWQDPNGWLVYFGKDTTNIDIKLAEYQSIIAALQEDNLTPALISLEFLHAPFYRLEQ